MKKLLSKIEEDNLFLLSSSTSYYSALAIAPFLMILLGVASLVGSNVQHDIVQQATQTISPEVGQMIQMIFKNVNEGVNFASLTGLVGVVVLLYTASLVFLQLRYSFNVIYNYFQPEHKTTTWALIKERLFAMSIVLLTGIFFIASFTFTAIANRIINYFGSQESLLVLFGVFLVNFFIYFLMFMGIHYFAPSRKPKLRDAAKISLFSSVFFIVGNILLASYLKIVAAGSIYGAAGTLLVFLTWSYYTTFTIFLSVEVFLYLKRINRIR